MKKKEKIIHNDLFVSTGNLLLDLHLTGKPFCGFKLGKIFNIYGDKSTAKTGLVLDTFKSAIASDLPIKCIYIDTENAFDIEHARNLGLDISKVEIIFEKELETIFKILIDKIKNKKENEYIIFAIDSLDGAYLKDEKDIKNAGSGYGTARARYLSQIFRILTDKLEKHKVLMLIISQERDNINAGIFGKKGTKSGGRAIDFYSYGILRLVNVGKISKIIYNNEYLMGIKLKIIIEKNKQSYPYSSIKATYLFDSGFDNINDIIDYLKENNMIEQKGAWLYYNNENYNGIEKFKQAVLKDKQLLKQIIRDVIETYKNSIDIRKEYGEEVKQANLNIFKDLQKDLKNLIQEETDAEEK